MIFSVLSLLSFLILLFLGFNLTVFNGRRGINRILAVFCYGGAFIGLGELLIYFSPTLHQALFIGNFLAPWPLFQAAFLHFVLTFTRNPLGKSKLLLTIHYTIAAGMAVLFFRYLRLEKPIDYFHGFFLESPITTEIQYSIILLWVTLMHAVSFLTVFFFTVTRSRGSDIRRQGLWLTASMMSIFGFAILLHTIKLTLFPLLPEMTGTQYLLFGAIFYMGIRRGNLLDLLPHQVADRILYTMDEVVVITDSDFKVLRINAAAGNRFPRLLGEDTSTDLRDIIGNSSSAEQVDFLYADEDFARRSVRLIDPAGRVHWYSISRSRVKKSWSGLNCFVFTASDITTLKENIDEREVLLAEIHHRVGNNLQLVLSLIDIKLRNTDERNALEVIIGLKDFIYAMASAHRVLYETDTLNSVPLEEYLREVHADFIRNHPVVLTINVSYDLNGYSLDISTSLLVALVFLETMTLFSEKSDHLDGEKSLDITVTRRGSILALRYDFVGIAGIENSDFEDGLSGLLLDILEGSITREPGSDRRKHCLEILLNPEKLRSAPSGSVGTRTGSMK